MIRLFKTKFTIVICLAPLASFSSAAQSKQDSVWLPFRYFIGKWKGTSEGQPGKGTCQRTYSFGLNKRYIEINNKSIYAPSNENPQGEVHEDRGYISYDNIRKTFVLRQFHIEGFVNQYRIDSISADGKLIVFISEAIENIPAGFRARESYEIINDKRIIETFEIAEPGKDFEVYSKAILEKI